jgi:hypothetical protein
MKYAPVNPSGSGVVINAKDTKFVGKKVSISGNMSNGTHATHIKSSIN